MISKTILTQRQLIISVSQAISVLLPFDFGQQLALFFSFLHFEVVSQTFLDILQLVFLLINLDVNHNIVVLLKVLPEFSFSLELFGVSALPVLKSICRAQQSIADTVRDSALQRNIRSQQIEILLNHFHLGFAILISDLKVHSL